MPRNSVTSTLESFPVELFLELFKFFNTIELYRAFFGLNWRINSILCQREHKNTLTLVSEEDLKFFLEQSAKSSNFVLSPSNIKSLKFGVNPLQLFSIHPTSGESGIFLSGGAPTETEATEVKKTCYGLIFSPFQPQRIKKFFSGWWRSPPLNLPLYPLSSYKELHTLIITDIDTDYHTDAGGTEFNDLMSQAAQLENLHTLELRSSTKKKNSLAILENLIKLIFEEEKCFLSLKRYRFTLDLEYEGHLYFHQQIAPKLTKIEYLILPSLLWTSFLELTSCLPAVKSIKVADIIVDPYCHQRMPKRTILPLCTSFTLISSLTAPKVFEFIFYCFPNLEKLIVVINHKEDVMRTLTGLEWERIISTQFLKLKKFQLTLHKLTQRHTTFTGNFWLERKTSLVYDQDNVTISFEISM